MAKAQQRCQPLAKMTDAIEQAEEKFRAGQFQQGLELLGETARRGNADAIEYLANLSLAGSLVRRDLPLSRDLFRRAAAAGSRSAAQVYRAFLANGTGAPADWAAAVRLLEDAARNDGVARAELTLIKGMALSATGEPIQSFKSEQISQSPEIVRFPSLFSSDECDFLIDRAMPVFSPSTVVDPYTGELVPNPVRTSDAAAFPLVAESPAIHALCLRLASASNTAVKQGEPLQVLRYAPGQQYKPHFDAIANVENQRVLTFLVYLNDDYQGGETEFLSTGLKIVGKKGDGLLFRNADDTGRLDTNSQHAGVPVTSGLKYLASRWIRERPFTPA